MYVCIYIYIYICIGDRTLCDLGLAVFVVYLGFNTSLQNTAFRVGLPMMMEGRSSNTPPE